MTFHCTSSLLLTIFIFNVHRVWVSFLEGQVNHKGLLLWVGSGRREKKDVLIRKSVTMWGRKLHLGNWTICHCICAFTLLYTPPFVFSFTFLFELFSLGINAGWLAIFPFLSLRSRSHLTKGVFIFYIWCLCFLVWKWNQFSMLVALCNYDFHIMWSQNIIIFGVVSPKF